MASLASGVTLSLGLLSFPVRIESARETEKSLKLVCVGQKDAHDPLPVSQKLTCTECGEVDRSTLKKGERQGKDSYVVVEEDEIVALKQEHDEPYKGKITLLAHPAPEFEAATAQGQKLYQLIPDPAGGNLYALLARLIGSRPDLAFVARYTIRTRVATYRVRPNVAEGNAVLLLEERITEDKLKPLPVLAGVVDENLAGMAAEMINNLVTPYDPATYADTYRAALNDLLASRTPELASGTVVPFPEDLAAKIAEFNQSFTKKSRRKAS